MSKINNKNIITNVNYGLKILTIFAFILIFVPFNKAAANQCGEAGCNYNYVTEGANYTYPNPPIYQPPIYTPPTTTTTPTVYSNTSNPVVTVNYTPTKPKVTTAVVKKPTCNCDCCSVTDTPVTTTDTTDDSGTLTANAIYGSNSFLPSGLIQWLLFAIFILLMVILVRKIFGAEKNYHESPLKHG